MQPGDAHRSVASVSRLDTNSNFINYELYAQRNKTDAFAIILTSDPPASGASNGSVVRS